MVNILRPYKKKKKQKTKTSFLTSHMYASINRVITPIYHHFRAIYCWYISDESRQIRTETRQNTVRYSYSCVTVNQWNVSSEGERQKGGVRFQRPTCRDQSERNELVGKVCAEQRMTGGRRASTGLVGWTRSRSCDGGRQGSRTRPAGRNWCRGRPPHPQSPTAVWSGGPLSPPWSSQRMSC